MSNLALKEPAAPSEKPVSLKVAEDEACFQFNVNNVDNASTMFPRLKRVQSCFKGACNTLGQDSRLRCCGAGRLNFRLCQKHLHAGVIFSRTPWRAAACLVGGPRGGTARVYDDACEILEVTLAVVPHKAVAEVSKIGNL